MWKKSIFLVTLLITLGYFWFRPNYIMLVNETNEVIEVDVSISGEAKESYSLENGNINSKMYNFKSFNPLKTIVITNNSSMGDKNFVKITYVVPLYSGMIISIVNSEERDEILVDKNYFFRPYLN